MGDNPPAGWYPDPNDPELARYWDGKGWTDYTGPRKGQSGPPRDAPPEGAETTPPEGAPPEGAPPEGAAPTVPPPRGVARPVPVDRPKRLGGPARVAYVVLGLTIVANLVAIPLALEYADKIQTQIDDRSLTYQEAVDAEDAYVVSSGVYGLASVVAIVGFLIWWYRAYSNLPAITGQRWRFGRGWAIGAWFIPFFNFVRPKQLGNDIWRGGDPRARGNPNWTSLPVSSLVHWWWALFLLASILGGIAGGLTSVDLVLSDSVPHPGLDPADLTTESDLKQEHAAAVVNAASSAIEVIAGVTAIVFIKRASDRQDERIAEGEPAEAAT
jgi:eukaryotic-like serine/threonine-protein kinase